MGDVTNISEFIHGQKRYQIRARETLPILVRQAKAQNPIFYSDLAKELGMPNARNLNYVLSSIGRCLKELSQKGSIKPPPIQCIVLNKNTLLPGEGVDWFKASDFKNLNRMEKQQFLDRRLDEIWTFPEWDKVLKTLNLQPINTDFSNLVPTEYPGAGGESAEHEALKNYVCKNPSLVGLSKKIKTGEIEKTLPSGDKLDVSFKNDDIWCAVEVKSRNSNEKDISRGIFQCVKYAAVMQAVQKICQKKFDIRAVLVIECTLSPKLLELKNTLGVEVYEKVKPD